jgi:transcriptional regulator with XRE-family HTH domain
MKRARPYSPRTVEAGRLLGRQVQLARHEHSWSESELAERVGVTRLTLRKVERGDLSVELGIALEAAALLGIPLFHEDELRLRTERARIDERLTLLPRRVRQPSKVDDDF